MRGSCHQLSRNGGFTWTEVLVSILVLTVVVIATTSLLFDAMAWVRMNRWDNIARMAAVRELERIKALPWSSISALPLYPNFLEGTTGLEEIPGAVGRVYVSNYNGQPTIKQITVAAYVYGPATPRSVWRVVSLVSANDANQ